MTRVYATMQNVWIIAASSSGDARPYYWNLVSRETVWDDPRRTHTNARVLTNAEAQDEINTLKALEVDEAEEADPNPRPKPARTAYHCFTHAKRDQVTKELAASMNKAKVDVAEVMRRLGGMWRDLSPEERKTYEDLAVKDKERFERERAAWEAAHPDEGQREASFESGLAIIPPSKVRELVKKDKDVGKIQPQALVCLARAADLFVKTLAEESLARSRDKKRLRQIDVHHVAHADAERFGFLTMDLEPPSDIVFREEREARERKAAAAAKASGWGASTSVAVTGKGSITAFLRPKPVSQSPTTDDGAEEEDDDAEQDDAAVAAGANDADVLEGDEEDTE